MSTRLFHAITIARPVDAVVDYASTPARWPEWHPSSLRLYGDVDRPLVAGDVFEEDVRAGGRTGHLKWNVVASERAQRWVAHADVDNGARLVLTYRFAASLGGCAFERELVYDLPSAWLRLLNVLVLRRRIEAESRHSLERLKARLEQG
jgi:hypothetical protein